MDMRCETRGARQVETKHTVMAATEGVQHLTCKKFL